MKMPLSKQKAACARKFLYYFRGGFGSEKYNSWERDYKWTAHLAWKENLHKKEFQRLIDAGDFKEIARRAVWLESRTNLLFSFEKMALRDAVKDEKGAESFALGLFDFVYGKKSLKEKVESFAATLSALPRKQTRVLTWPLLTVFGFIADPVQHIFLKPKVTKEAARKYGYDFQYQSKPNWETYSSLLGFANELKKDLAAMKPVDMIDIQSFIWVLGSDEYPD